MITLSKPQRLALKKLFDRQTENRRPEQSRCRTYRQFRASVQPFIGGGCVLVEWCGMWVGIEPDGYTHT